MQTTVNNLDKAVLGTCERFEERQVRCMRQASRQDNVQAWGLANKPGDNPQLQHKICMRCATCWLRGKLLAACVLRSGRDDHV